MWRCPRRVHAIKSGDPGKNKVVCTEPIHESGLLNTARQSVILNGARRQIALYGEMAEWTKALAWKASRRGKTSSRGFESLSLRHFDYN